MDRVTSGISCFSRAIQKRVFLFKILHDYENIIIIKNNKNIINILLMFSIHAL